MKTIDQILNYTHAIFKFDSDLRCFYKLCEGYIYTSKKRVNLLTLESEEIDFSFLKNEFFKFKMNKDFHKEGRVFVLNYELGFLFDEENFKFKAEEILGYYLHFSDSFIVDIDSFSAQPVAFESLSKPSYEEYFKKFNSVYKHLEEGDCYQLNLTQPFVYKFSTDKMNIYKNFLKVKNLSEFAHSIFIREIDYLHLSNSPECLFEMKGDYLYSRPIKGTISSEHDIGSLNCDKKNITELNIVTDLMRNDLSLIGESFSEVVSGREIFSVPGLHHLCSVIRVKINPEKISLLEIFLALFPGASISGAPKKRVIKIIREIEGYKRSFYTGSTVLFYEDLKKASINIRTAKIEGPAQKLTYGAGGGVTLLSDCASEYREAYQKVSSFLSLFNI